MEDLTEQEKEFNHDLTNIVNIYKTIEVDDNGQASFRSERLDHVNRIKYKQVSSSRHEMVSLVSYLAKVGAKVKQHKGRDYYNFKVEGTEFLWPVNKVAK